jgi:predicted transcriptional regulator
MQQLAQNDIAAKATVISTVIDHLVAALGGEPACTLRRALILIDIDQHPGTAQAGIMERMDVHKSALNRDIDWLYDYGCIIRHAADSDGRLVQLRICGYAKKNMDLALAYFNYDHNNLKNFLLGLINLFGQHKPTLRDAKIVSVIGDKRSITRQEIFESLYNGPTTTDNRAVNNLINFGLVQKDDA